MKVQYSNFGGNDTFGYQLHEEKYNFHLHIHQFVELALVLDGELSVSISGGEPQIARAGDFILIFPFQTHKYSSNRVNKFAIYTFSPSFISDFIGANHGRVGVKSVFKADKSTYDLFLRRFIEKQDFSLYSIRACMYAMLSDFTNQVELCEYRADNNALEKLLVYVKEYYSSALPLSKVARDLGYSSNYLSHCIKKTFSFGYPTLLAYIRVEQAKKLVMETNKSALDIAFECGFGSERSFNRQFKETTGFTMREYRKNNKITIRDNESYYNLIIRKKKENELSQKA